MKNSILFGRYSYKYLIPFTHQLSTMVQAGLPIARALRTLANQQKSYSFRAVIDDLSKCVEAGQPLSQAMKKHPRAFDTMYVRLIESAEKSGMLENALDQLTKYLERKRNIRRQVIRALIYPAFVLCFAVLIFAALRFVLLPMFAGASSGSNPINKTVGSLLTLVDTVLGLAVFVPILIILLASLLRQTELGTYIVDWVKLHIPIIGGVFRRAALARFTRSLGVLTGAGVSILDALSMSREVTGNEVIARQIDFAKETVKTGSSLTEPLRVSRTIDPAVVDMIEVGEESGKLEESLLKVADYYEDEVETMIHYLMGLLKPTLIILLCLLMGYMILTMWSVALSAAGLR